MTEMTVIQQDSPAFTSANTSVLAAMDRKKYSTEEPTTNSFYSKYNSTIFPILRIEILNAFSFSKRNSGLDDLLTRSSKPAASSRDSDWDMLSDFIPASKSSAASSLGSGPSSNQGGASYGSSSNSRTPSGYGSGSSRDSAPVSNSGEAQKKFGNAKAISSDQFFQDSGAADVTMKHISTRCGSSSDVIFLSFFTFAMTTQYERRSNLSRFEGQSSISSSDYFGTGNSRGNSSRNSGGASLNIQVQNIESIAPTFLDSIFFSF